VAPKSEPGHPLCALRMAEVIRRVGLKETSIRKLMARGEFPHPFPLSDGGRAKAFLESEVDDWLAARAAARRQNVTFVPMNNKE
jgi:prophage regulatory protein